LRLALLQPLLMLRVGKHVARAASSPLTRVWVVQRVSGVGGAEPGLLRNFEDIFGLGSRFLGRIVNFDGVQLCKFFSFYEATLVPESLVCEVLAATIAYLLMRASIRLLGPVAQNLLVAPFILTIRICIIGYNTTRAELRFVQ
jgi:hypothetical protein